MKLYLRTTTDALELPLCVAGSSSELARMTGKSDQSIRSAISHGHKGWHRVVIDDEDEFEDFEEGEG